MASAPHSPVSPDDLTREEWWALFDELRLAQQTEYAPYGGPAAFFRKERDTDADLA